MSMQVFPTAPSPTVTHLTNLPAFILRSPIACGRGFSPGEETEKGGGGKQMRNFGRQ
ncbi:unnamed protein product [Spirodela intermedia]|uniref:Uncharacterized protein n=1 Tax=Spirodela intermedia TaxID=51605 RepID=A0A7I8LJE4_SPIIN|nr:unnamed protein product [Spirodela intermedia]